MRYHRFGIAPCLMEMRYSTFAIASTGPPYLGVEGRNSHTFLNQALICANHIVQLTLLQWVTGNKTFPGVCDQYTIKQLQRQRHRTLASSRLPTPLLAITSVALFLKTSPFKPHHPVGLPAV